MFIKETYFIPLVLSLTLFVLVLIFLVVKKKLPIKKTSYILIISGIVVFVALQSYGKKVYIVNPDYQVTEFIALGSFSVIMEENNNEKVKGSIALNRVGVINKSAKPLMLEEITYANNSYSNSSNEYTLQEIEPYSIEEVFTRTGKIDYFFEERIPESVRTTRSSEQKYHLFKLK